jgi:hypothetical protein
MEGHYAVTTLLDFAVPFALVIILLDITLVYHASRTGRLQPWAFIILMIPVMGAVAYIVVELLPEMLNGPGAQQTRRRVASRLDPERRYRELSDHLAATDTIANRAALAEECLSVGRFDEAERHFDRHPEAADGRGAGLRVRQGTGRIRPQPSGRCAGDAG